jgi:hypothetical protein
MSIRGGPGEAIRQMRVLSKRVAWSLFALAIVAGVILS